jgi:signal transduction histidine kinase
MGCALLSLIGNAARSIDARFHRARLGRITIGARVVNDTVEIRVADNGAPLTAEAAAAVFQPDVAAGSGHNLAFVRDIVDQHGGSISVEREPGGTTFVMRMPLPAPSAKLLAA